METENKDNVITDDASMPTDDDFLRDWNALAKGLLRAEMAKRHMRPSDLSAALHAIGVAERPDNLKNKISRGRFSAAFLLQCLAALGVKTLHLD